MKTLAIPTAKQPVVLAERLFKLERRGRYLDALIELSDIWPDFNFRPDVDSFEATDAAEMLLRCGSLIGQHGHNAQIPDAEIRSKDLLTDARNRFIDLAIQEKAAECENHLAFAFWRTGEFNEADNWLEESFGRDLPPFSDARLYAHLLKSLIDLSGKRWADNVENGNKLIQAFRQHGDAFLIGSFYTNIGLSYRNLGNKTEALGHLELAKYYHRRSGHKIYLGTVENNLALLYKETGKFIRAHEAIDNATRLFKQLKDKTREGYSLDTKAAIYIAEAKYSEANRVIDKALSIMRRSQNSAYLAETLLTKAKTLLFLDNFSDAVFCLIKAVNISRTQTGDIAAKRMIAEFETALHAKNNPPKKGISEGDLELILPKSIGHYADYRGVWINNTRLDGIGLVQGSLAIVVKDQITRGDLVALEELESCEISCGFYDADFGIVCIEAIDGEPQIFDEKDVRLLGKIVGVCNSGQREDGKMVVESLKI